MKISEVSKKYDIPVDTLRYYEKAGLLPNVKRTQAVYVIIRKLTVTGWNLLNACEEQDCRLRYSKNI